MSVEKKKVSMDAIKAILSMVSMAVLSIQHFMGAISDKNSIAYISLSITFLTIFIGNWGKTKGIKIISLITCFFVFFCGIILYYINDYGIINNSYENFAKIYEKVISGIIGVFSLTLCILYAKELSKLG